MQTLKQTLRINFFGSGKVLCVHKYLITVILEKYKLFLYFYKLIPKMHAFNEITFLWFNQYQMNGFSIHIDIEFTNINVRIHSVIQDYVLNY
jgi:hypothetical protein